MAIDVYPWLVNPERLGTDLAFDTDLLYPDVTQRQNWY